MLQPAHRLTLVSALRPPAGFVFDAAMAVTFTLDLRALLAVPAALTLTESPRSSTGETGIEPVDLLHAVRAHAGNLTIFAQAGEIGVPPSRKVFTFLEDCVVPVTAPRHGIVHPKVWVVRYRSSEDDEMRMRVISASRNLTFDTSWDTVLVLEESVDGGGADLGAVADMFDGLIGAGKPPNEAAHQERVRSLNESIRGARFSLPDGIDALRVHVMGLGNSSSPLPKDADRSLVVSPFVSDGFFTKVHRGPIDTLVSLPEQLDTLKSESLANVESVRFFDDGSSFIQTGDEAKRTLSDPARPLRGLHAKIFAYEVGREAHVFVGSANATEPAFGNNVEILFELIGPIDHLGIDRLTGGNGDEPGFSEMWLPYVSGGADTPPQSDSKLDAARKKLGLLRVTGQVETDGDDWAVTYTSRAQIPVLDGVTLECWPLPVPVIRQRVEAGPLKVRFAVSLDSISRFLVFRLTDSTTKEFTEVLVPAHLVDVPEQRDRHLMASLVGSADRFYAYMLAMLEGDVDDFSSRDHRPRSAIRGGDDESGVIVLPVLERMVRAMRSDPTRLLALDPLVRDLSSDDVLDDDFIDLWSALLEIATETLEIDHD